MTEVSRWSFTQNLLHNAVLHAPVCKHLDLSVSVNAVTVLSHQAFAQFLLHILYCMPLARKYLNLSASVIAFGTCCIAEH